ncbi:hypothetical protein [Streptomyces axinellae]|uniref:Uncharacterized protein n=1 Tax=Streptomyces axinellae TaxID=552788 RepID=A0ABN3QXV2_9ACTN
MEFTSTVDAEQLRFDAPPETDVRFHGSPGRASDSRSRRHHLPDPVEADHTYDDVSVDYRLTTRLRRGIDRLRRGTDGPDHERNGS